jgi:hypothetical protein
MTYLLVEIGRWVDRVCRPDARSRPATESGDIKVEESPNGLSQKLE